MTRAVSGTLVVMALAVALAFRLAAPDARPMHHDEANQAVRFGTLLETRQYEYDRHDHHGPTLYYLTLPVAWMRGQATLASLDERTIRLVPTLFGVGVIALFLALARRIGRGAVVAGAWLAALSPVLTYYSRFYIHETLFVFFALAFLIALGRYVERPRGGTAVLAGMAAGLAYATKETSAIVLPAALVAVVVARVWSRPGHAIEAGPGPGRLGRSQHLALGLSAGLAVAFVFYSSFFSHPAGFVESILAFGVYFGRGLGATAHIQDWDYYLRLLAFSRSGGVLWTEALVLLLAILGVVAAVRQATGGFWPRYIALFTLLCAAAFSAIPYKTPWNLLPFYAGVVMLAGIGASALLCRTTSRAARVLALSALVAGCSHLGVQAWHASVRYAADPWNPYVYAQTVPDFLRLVRRIDEMAALHPDREAMLIRVFAGPYEQWPLPWYLRRMTQVGYWTRTEDAARIDDAPVIVASQDNIGTVVPVLGDRYVSEFYGLRPDVILSLYIERGLWERFLASRTQVDPGGGDAARTGPDGSTPD